MRYFYFVINVAFIPGLTERRARGCTGSRLHMAVDTLGHLLALHVTPASDEDRAHADRMAEAIQAATEENVNLPAMARRGLAGG